MTMNQTLSLLSANLWGLKDFNLSSFLIGQVRRELTLDRSKLDNLVFSRLKQTLEFAEQHTEHYANFFRSYGVSARDLKSFEDLGKFPCLTRAQLRNDLMSVVADGKIQKSWRASATGGTTSSPVTFYCDREALWWKNAAAHVFNEYYGKRIGDRIAYLWGAPQDFQGQVSLGRRLRALTYRRDLMLPSTPLNETVLASHTEKLLQWRPAFIQAYPSALYELCQYLQEHNIRLPFLKGVSVTAETLHDHHRRLIEGYLDLRVFNWYGSRECSKVASECECHEGMHINEPDVYVEIEEDPNLPADCGHLVITDLRNRATPLIRYRTDDVAQKIPGQCRCGRALKRFAGVEGRLVDMLVLPGGKKVPGVSMVNRIVKSYHEISKVQIVQKKIDTFLLRYVPGPQFADSSLNKLAQSLCTLLDTKVQVLFEKVETLPREKSGKVRFVVSELPKDAS